MMIRNKRNYWLIHLPIYFLALVALFFLLGFLALRFGLTKTPGYLDGRDRYFSEVAESLKKNKSVLPAESVLNQCRLLSLGQVSPELGQSLSNLPLSKLNPESLDRALVTLELFWQGDKDYKQKLTDCLKSKNSQSSDSKLAAPFRWLASPEWRVLKEAILKDEIAIKRAGEAVGLNPRLIVAMLVGEQLRLYNTEREIYKRAFAPLRILGVQSQFSWGVLGLKEETAREIEINLKDKKSPFYLGSKAETLLDFKTDDKTSERFYRLVNEDDRYYSYLYTAIYLKQLSIEWERAGHAIDKRPEILATLFNLGFAKSEPKANPQVGGAEIEIGGQIYSFGSLAAQFYYSGELLVNFPWD